MTLPVTALAAADARRSTEPLGDRAALERTLRDAWSYGLTSGLIRPTHQQLDDGAPRSWGRGRGAVAEPQTGVTA